MAVLVALTLAVGTGSFLFHTFATMWAALADVIPITLFILAYLAIAMRRFVGLGWIATLATVPAYLVLSVAFEGAVGGMVDPRLRGSVGYLPALFALVGVGAFIAVRRGHPAGRWLLGAGWLFAVSLVFRTLDLPLCGSFALGTHFLWHLLNGVLLGVLVLAVIRHGPPQAPAGGGDRPLAGAVSR